MGNLEHLAFGPGGDLFIAEYSGGSSAVVLRYDFDTSTLSSFITSGTGGLGGPTGIAFGPDGNLYVSDFNAQAIRRFDGNTGAFIDNYATGIGKVEELAWRPDQQVTITSNGAPIAVDDHSYSNELNRHSPVTHFTFGESGGTSADDTGSANNDATYVGGTLGQAGGITGSGDTAVYLDGTGDYVQVTHHADYLLNNGTIGLWFNADSPGGARQELFSKDAVGNVNGGHLSMYLTSAGKLEVRYQDISANYFVSSATGVSGSTWHHAAVSFGDNGLKLYLDGSEVDTNAVTKGLGTSSGGSGNAEGIAIGASRYNTPTNTWDDLRYFFQGYLDEFSIVGRQLTAAEIGDLYAAGISGGTGGYAAGENGTLHIDAASGVLNNDSDPENGTLTVVEVNGAGGSVGSQITLASGALLTLNADGSFDYDTNSAFDGLAAGDSATDSFDYTVSDPGGETDTATVTITITGAANTAPSVTNSGTALAYVENDGAVTVDAGLIVTDADSIDLAGATVQILGGFASSEDSLAFVDQGGINGSYDADSGVLTLTGTASVANYQAALRSVTYHNTSEDPDETNRVIQFQASDGTASGSDSRTITVAAANDAPVMNNTGNLALTSIVEDDLNNNGDLVSDILASDGGNPVTDADAGALQGIAITSLSSSNGTWQYNIGGGWFDVGSVSFSESLLLRDTDRLRFVPDGRNAETAFVTFSAWDQTTGTSGNKVDTEVYEATGAYSFELETASVAVGAVNDTPTFFAAGPMVFSSSKLVDNSVTLA